MTIKKLSNRLLVAGVDEVGRGCLCYDVVVAAVILDPKNPIKGLCDSKVLTAKRRNELAVLIKEKALSYAIVHIDSQIIDQINILQASLLGMKRAVEELSIVPDQVLVDGNKTPEIALPVKAIVKGDSLIPAISAASILAKVDRDQAMLKLHNKYPQYAFDKHKGYPTKLHLQSIKRYGILDFYRKSYKPVQRIIQETSNSQN
ncbi:MAG: ribonuclease HII [Pseudomonadota bacterium]